MRRPRLCSFGEDEVAARAIKRALTEMGIVFERDEPIELRPDDDMATIFEKVIEPSDFIVVIHDKNFASSKLGARFLRTLSLTSMNRDDKVVILVKTDDSPAAFGLELLPTFKYEAGELLWREKMAEFVEQAA